uniref:Uncharacterized protein n=1 Tax=Anopheles coluzzii TaxID=1518534 RepID=A0A8W7PXV8_ANOCL
MPIRGRGSGSIAWISGKRQSRGSPQRRSKSPPPRSSGMSMSMANPNSALATASAAPSTGRSFRTPTSFIHHLTDLFQKVSLPVLLLLILLLLLLLLRLLTIAEEAEKPTPMVVQYASQLFAPMPYPSRAARENLSHGELSGTALGIVQHRTTVILPNLLLLLRTGSIHRQIVALQWGRKSLRWRTGLMARTLRPDTIAASTNVTQKLILTHFTTCAIYTQARAAHVDTVPFPSSDCARSSQFRYEHECGVIRPPHLQSDDFTRRSSAASTVPSPLLSKQRNAFWSTSGGSVSRSFCANSVRKRVKLSGKPRASAISSSSSCSVGARSYHTVSMSRSSSRPTTPAWLVSSRLNSSRNSATWCCSSTLNTFDVGRFFALPAIGERVVSMTPPGPGRALGLPIRYVSIWRAACRPSEIAHTTSDWPRRQSPAAKTFGFAVPYMPTVVLMLPRPSSSRSNTGKENEAN